eukprot:TRINITY_DN14786_c0_g1_i1.p1 TRINITY_DN14786_c0_g1~~TRINITY_DN14786_c0_g1_i1.p1  ORF type:complete len:249 (+),score=88.74 TRINITY_DN14786_c0_g1_i1:56-748(+)
MPVPRRGSVKEQYDSINDDISREVARQLKAREGLIDKHRSQREAAEMRLRNAAAQGGKVDKVTLAGVDTLEPRELERDGAQILMLTDPAFKRETGTVPDAVVSLATRYVCPRDAANADHDPVGSRSTLIEWVRRGVDTLSVGQTLYVILDPAVLKGAVAAACSVAGDSSLSEETAFGTVVRAAFFASQCSEDCPRCVLVHDGTKGQRAALLATLREIRIGGSTDGAEWFR